MSENEIIEESLLTGYDHLYFHIGFNLGIVALGIIEYMLGKRRNVFNNEQGNLEEIIDTREDTNELNETPNRTEEERKNQFDSNFED